VRGAHYWARKLQERGFTVKLIAPQFVKPYVQSNKNDANDAEAICEAMSRPKMRFVAVKTVEQQDIQAVHRIRGGLIEQRTAKGNQIRGLVSEYGLVAPRQLIQLRRAVVLWLEDAGNGLSERFRRLLKGLWCDLQLLDERVAELDREIALIAHSDPAPDGCNSFAESDRHCHGAGSGSGRRQQFANGRQMAAALGLTPKQHSSGGKERRLGISKRGDAYLRTV